MLADAQSGDRAAIDRLLEEHRPGLRRVVELRLDHAVQRRIDVSDVVQDVMVEASNRLETYLHQPQLAFPLWLRQIAWDHIIDAYRRHRGSAKRSLDREQPLASGRAVDQSSLDLVSQLADPMPTPFAAATQRELAQQLEVAVQQLGETDREIVLMRHYEHLTNQEIAEALGLNPPAASMRYLRAIRRLKSLLEELHPPSHTDLR
jgi:RNA polymerase sigma-70 factor (ECF subfamily)